MSDNNAGRQGGIGFLGLLAILFIALKLTGYITWSWWWVLAPVWIPWSIALVIGLVVGGLILASRLGEGKQGRQSRKTRKALDDYRRSL